MMLALVNFLPLYYYNDGTYLYSYGPATNLLYIVGGICIVFDIFCVCKNIKNISSKKYYPLFVLILLLILKTNIIWNHDKKKEKTKEETKEK